MFNNFEEFKKYIHLKKAAVLGVGISNKPLIKFIADLGARVTAFDRSEKDNPYIMETIKEFESGNYKLQWSLGEGYLDNLKDFDIIFKTPMMRPDTKEILMAAGEGSLVTSEMEIFFEICPCKIIGITGSDGKTTTSTIISEILMKEGYKVHLGGNIGTPLLSRIEEIGEEDFAVVELSSFQLQTMKKSPDIAIITNITPNHLDFHLDFQEYIDSKKNIFLYQNPDDILVLNESDEVSKDIAKDAVSNIRWFPGRMQDRANSYPDFNPTQNPKKVASAEEKAASTEYTSTEYKGIDDIRKERCERDNDNDIENNIGNDIDIYIDKDNDKNKGKDKNKNVDIDNENDINKNRDIDIDIDNDTDNDINNDIGKDFEYPVFYNQEFFYVKSDIFSSDISADNQSPTLNSFYKINISDIKIMGRHNLDNYSSAILALKDFVSLGSIIAVMKEFAGVPHRIEFVRNINGVDYYNSSIDSSPTRTLATLSVFFHSGKKVVLIAGGKDKKCDYTHLGKGIVKTCVAVVLCGANADLIEKSIKAEPSSESIIIYKSDNYYDAVKKARDIALPGQAVLLSNAGTSFDMFKNFEERGNFFKKIVREL